MKLLPKNAQSLITKSVVIGCDICNGVDKTIWTLITRNDGKIEIIKTYHGQPT